MRKLQFDRAKATEMMMHIISKIQSCDVSTLMKTCYLADVNHLKRYGRPVTGNTYTKKKQGVVAVEIDDIIQLSLQSEGCIALHNGILKAKREADLMELSESDTECIDCIIEALSNMTPDELSSACHGFAWQSTNPNDEIKLEALLEEIGNEALTQYILTGS